MSHERITVMTGPLAGKQFDIERALSIGRNPDNDIVVSEDRQVSRQHARIERTPNGTMLKDLGSGNGTFVDGRRILEYRLSDGVIFRVGGTELKYEGTSAPLTEGPKGDSRVRLRETVEGELQAKPAEAVFETLFAAPPGAVEDKELKATRERLHAIYKANQIISSERDLKKLFTRVMDQLFELVPANNGVIILVDPKTGQLTPHYERLGGTESEIHVSQTIVHRAFEGGEAVLVRDASADERFEAAASIVSGNIASAMCVPLTHQDEKLGVIYVDTRGTPNAFTEHDRELMVALAGPAAIAIKNARYVQQLQEDFETTLKLLSNAVELRDNYTAGHTVRVTRFSMEIAREMGFDEEKLKEVEMGGVMHDIGKIGVKDAVLCKPDRLTDEEYAQMKVHPEKGAALMKDAAKLVPLIPYCLYHHERFDGRGYPYGLKGEDIPIEGRIVAVADTFDAMTSNRPYRKGLDPEIAIQEIEKNKGAQFDPICADAFIRAYRKGRISPILQMYHQNDKSIVCPFCSTYVPIPQDAQLGDVFGCDVCHRSMRLREKNEAYYGERVAETELPAAAHAAR